MSGELLLLAETQMLSRKSLGRLAAGKTRGPQDTSPQVQLPTQLHQLKPSKCLGPQQGRRARAEGLRPLLASRGSAPLASPGALRPLTALPCPSNLQHWRAG